RKPLLIRAALPNFAPPIDRVRLFELASNPQAESRLINASGRRRSLQHGPFARLPSLRLARWTLLVQGVDLLDDAAAELLARFRFIPDARLDDLMVSFATDGGGVGAHVDSYDVFLLQAFGQRRWKISLQRGLRASKETPLNNVAGFRASREWVLDPGDMLYLPPGVAHEGTAVGECMTFSIGFRAPSFQQLLEPWFADYVERVNPRGRYKDRGSSVASHPAALPRTMATRVHTQLARYRPSGSDTRRFLLRHLSEPKATTVFDAPATVSGIRLRRRASARGLRLDRKTRLIYSGAVFGINGDLVIAPRGASETLHMLADRRALSALQLQRAPSSTWPLLLGWYRAGWITILD
ncbi:MAG TPA: cupin domain-containing protein, partial [Burkholderiaceae bacterium]|nr:cupin domain-containing protein [Burkholderiaceae bacterium]